ncbi:VOC family protein [Microvirgula aerodenitrificans]|uniref:VOC family protein n=1 Tax=Microvirgula aerodenitrificans TaxID=57480 RepID=UPI0026AAC792
MIDHTGIVSSDFKTSKAFYTAALATIGYRLLVELPAAVTGHTDVAGFGEPPKPDFWISQGRPTPRPFTLHSVPVRERKSMTFTRQPLRRVGVTTGHPACAPTTTRTITAHSFLIRMATISRPSVTTRYNTAGFCRSRNAARGF